MTDEPMMNLVSREPHEISETVNYESRIVKCARCSGVHPAAPWPTNSTEYKHRPRCGHCGSGFMYPV